MRTEKSTDRHVSVFVHDHTYGRDSVCEEGSFILIQIWELSSSLIDPAAWGPVKAYFDL